MSPATVQRIAEIAKSDTHRPPQGGRPPPGRRTRRPRSTWRYLPQAVVVSLATIVLPLALVELVEILGGERSIFLSVAFAIALSAVIASVGAWIWQRLPGSRDILFGDLMVWGFVRRVRAERRLAETARLLGRDPLSPDGVDLDRSERIRILERLARALDARDPFMLGHSQRVARQSQMVAERMGLSAAQVTQVRVAAAVHDAGKINTPSAILNKPGALTDEEFEVIKRHPGDGAEMLAPLGDPEVVAMVRHHHERIDGSGYPDGLAGEDIPLGARIIAVADTFDAVTSVRPYRPPRKQHAALTVLKGEAGTRLDAAAVAAFISCYTGRRTAAWSSLAVAIPERLVGLLTGGAGPVAQGAAATIAIAGLGGALVNPALNSDPPPSKVAASPQPLVVKLSPGESAARRADLANLPRHGRSRRPAGSSPNESRALSDDLTNGSATPIPGNTPSGGPTPPAGTSPSPRGATENPSGQPDDSPGGGSITDLPQVILDLLRGRGGETPAPPTLPELPEVPELPPVPRL